MITAFWSNDPTFYITLFGSEEMVNNIFIKMNKNELDLTIDKFNMNKICDSTYVGSDGDKRYVCMLGDDVDKLLTEVNEIKKSL